MRGLRRDSGDVDSGEDLAVAAARFGMAVADDAAAFRALASEAQSMSLNEWGLHRIVPSRPRGLGTIRCNPPFFCSSRSGLDRTEIGAHVGQCCSDSS